AEEILLLALELVGGTGALALAQRRIARVEIEEERRIGLQAGMHEPLEGGDRLAVEAAAAALIGVRGIAEAVAQHPAARGEARLDHLAHVARAVGEHRDRLGERRRGMLQDHLAQRRAEARASRLARRDDLHAACGDPRAQELQVRGLPRPVDAFQRDEPAASPHALPVARPTRPRDAAGILPPRDCAAPASARTRASRRRARRSRGNPNAPDAPRRAAPPRRASRWAWAAARRAYTCSTACPARGPSCGCCPRSARPSRRSPSDRSAAACPCAAGWRTRRPRA